MNTLRRGLILVLVLLLGACALARQNAYDEWRSFYSQVDTMSAQERSAQFAIVRTRHEQSPSAITRLQLAYLTLLSTTSGAGGYQAGNAEALLKGIDDHHALAPVRDLLSRSLQLREKHASTTTELKKLRLQCDAVTDSRDKLQRERAVLQQEVAVCAEQVDALKEIESVMSDLEPVSPTLP